VATSTDDRWVVLVASKEDFRPDAVARGVAAFRGIPMADAAMAVRRCRGIVAEGVARAEAEGLAARLGAEGVSARAMPEASLAVLPAPLLLARLGPAPDGMRAEVRGSGERLVPWPRVRLVATAHLTATTQTKVQGKEGPSAGDMAMRAGAMALTGIPISFGKKKATERTVSRTEFLLLVDVVLRDPAERLRVQAQRFDWSGLGPRMAYNALANVRALAEEILRASACASRSLGTDLLLSGGPLTSLGYRGIEEFEREERWLLAVVPA
jgi:hypothetical protein